MIACRIKAYEPERIKPTGDLRNWGSIDQHPDNPSNEITARH